MTCAENRELHSALLDGELTTAERHGAEAHLSGCSECSGELERLARMLGLLHALPPTRAPIGFVDRVLAAEQPLPWYARLGRRLLQPWQVKLPIEAAAMVIVALGVVYVFQKTPELQQATRYEAPAQAPAPRESKPNAAPPASSTPPAAPTPATSAPTAVPPAPPTRAADAPVPAARPAEPPAVASRAEPPAAAEGGEREASKLESAVKERDPAGLGASRDTSTRAPSANVMMKDAAPAPAAPAPVAPSEEERAREKKATDRRDPPPGKPDAQSAPARQQLGRAAPASPAPSQLVAPDVSGRLVAGDRAAAEAALAELRNRLGVAEAFRRDAGGGTVSIEMVVPRAAYAELMRGLAGIGAWTVDREPAPDSADVRLQVLLMP
jgi:hypothetical protein